MEDHEISTFGINSIESSWKNYATNILLKTTEALDKCLQALPIIKREYERHNAWLSCESAGSFSYTATSSLSLIDELREVAMSVAVMERHLHLFAESYCVECVSIESTSTLIDQAEKGRQSSFGHLLNALGKKENSSHKNSFSSRKKGPYDWRYTCGLVSLLRFIHNTLINIHTTLQKLSNLTSWRGFLKEHFYLSVSPSFFTLLIFVGSKLRIPHNSLLSNAMLPFKNSVLSFFISKMQSWANALWVNRSKVLQFGILGALYYFLLSYLRRFCINRVQDHLRSLHRRLQMLQNMWVFVVSALHDKGSFRNSIDDSVEPFSPDPPISLWLLTQLPPSLNVRSCFWYEAAWQLRSIKLKFDVSYASVAFTFAVFGSRPLLHWMFISPFSIAATFYYVAFPDRAASRATDILTTPDYRLMKCVWSTFDDALFYLHSVSSYFNDLWIRDSKNNNINIFPQVAHSRDITLSGYVNSDNTLISNSKVDSFSISTGGYPVPISIDCTVYFPSNISAVQIDMFFSSINARIKPSRGHHTIDDAPSLLTNEDFEPNYFSRVVETSKPKLNRLDLLSSSTVLGYDELSKIKVSSRNSLHLNSKVDNLGSVILFIHGAGWICHLPACDRLLASIWTQETNCRVITVQYSLTPENCFPTALRECFETYRWILEGRLGYIPPKIFLIGDSVGGNLAAGVCLKCIEEQIRLPTQLYLAYPTLDLRAVISPSRLLFLMDTFAPINLMKQFRSMYVSSQVDINRNVFVSPLIAFDYQLARFPPCCILVSGLDPVSDDAILFGHRLEENGVQVKIKLYPDLPHAFFNYCHFVPEAYEAVSQISRWIKEEILL